MFLLSFPLPTMTFLAFSQYVLRLVPPFYAVFLHFPTFLLSLPLPTMAFPTFSCIFPWFCSHFLCLPLRFLHFHSIFLGFSLHHFSLYFLRFTLFSCMFPCFCSHFLCLPSHFLHFHSIFYNFYCIILPYSATIKADLGGIDTPPSANCLVVHNPAKCSIQPPFSQPESQIWSLFVNHSPPHPLFSLRSQTATSQLVGFRDKKNYFTSSDPHRDIILKHIRHKS